jgi:Spy/CpxP family protein refolding chaperone
MDFKNRTFLASLAATLGVVIVAGLGIVALGAQQGPPPGRGPGGSGGQGMHSGGMFDGPGGPGGQGPGMFRGQGGRGPMAGMMMRGLGQLDLTDAQKTQVRAAHESNREATRAIATRMIAAREALDDAVTADTVDKDAIHAAAAAVATVELDAALLRAKVHAQVFGVLTPEQQAKARQLRADGKGQMKQMMGRGGRAGRGPGGMGRSGGIGGWF